MSSVAIIDIGSTSVGGALLNVPRRKRAAKGQAPGEVCVEITKSLRHAINFAENIDITRFLAGMDEVLKQTIADLQQSGHGAPSRIICFLSSPFHTSQTRLITHTEPKPFTVTAKLIAKLLDAELTKFKQGQKDLFSETPHGYVVVENKIMQIKLNGYATVAPYHQRVNEIAITNFISLTSQDVIKRFQKIIVGGFHRSQVEWHSFAFTFFNILNGLLGSAHDFLLLDLGGEITELSLSWQGLLWHTASFPLGLNSLIRHLARELATTNEEAYSALKLYLDGQQRPAVAPKLELALEAIKSQWLAGFHQSLSPVVAGALLPVNIYLVGDLDLLPLFERWLEAESFADFAISAKKFSVNIIKPDWLDRFCQHGPMVGRDLSLMVEAIFCDKLLT